MLRVLRQRSQTEDSIFDGLIPSRLMFSFLFHVFPPSSALIPFPSRVTRVRLANGLPVSLHSRWRARGGCCRWQKR